MSSAATGVRVPLPKHPVSTGVLPGLAAVVTMLAGELGPVASD